jgi:hypothetical protein
VKLLIILLLVGCNGCVVKPKPDDPVDPDGGTCESACATGKQLSCPTFGNDGPDEVPETADDELCADVCLDFVSSEVPVDLDCLTAAKGCDQYAGCE